MGATVMEASEFGRKPGEQIGAYILEKPLGSGGFAEVWQATDPAAGRQVAIKIFFDRVVNDPCVWRAIREEPKKQPEHERIVPIYYCHLDSDKSGPYYVVMKFMRGGTLEERLCNTPRLSAGQSVAIITDVLSGLEYAHSQGIIHRDIKPTNILFDGNGRASLADFGIAKDLNKSGNTTVFGSVVGTATYMSHEQGEGLPITRATDIYSVGTVLYEMLAGKVPFDGPTDTAVIVARSKSDPAPLRSIVQDVPERLEKVILNCLARNLEHRYADCAALCRALDWAMEPILSPRPSIRHWKFVFAGLLLLALVGIFAYFQFHKSPLIRNVAEKPAQPVKFDPPVLPVKQTQVPQTTTPPPQKPVEVAPTDPVEAATHATVQKNPKPHPRPPEPRRRKGNPEAIFQQ